MSPSGLDLLRFLTDRPSVPTFPVGNLQIGERITEASIESKPKSGIGGLKRSTIWRPLATRALAAGGIELVSGDYASPK